MASDLTFDSRLGVRAEVLQQFGEHVTLNNHRLG
ncbi:MAG: hypothetical protein RJA70_2966 [Pseudomonadota bacterium]|jgi:hypothetical protein